MPLNKNPIIFGYTPEDPEALGIQSPSENGNGT